MTSSSFDAQFDLVVSVDNLEHVEDDVTAMAGLLRALRPGGRWSSTSPATSGAGSSSAAG